MVTVLKSCMASSLGMGHKFYCSNIATRLAAAALARAPEKKGGSRHPRASIIRTRGQRALWRGSQRKQFNDIGSLAMNKIDISYGVHLGIVLKIEKISYQIPNAA